MEHRFATLTCFLLRRHVASSSRNHIKIDDSDPVIVKHGGCEYVLHELLLHIPSKSLQAVGATAPANPQAVWDEVVRRWPTVAADAVSSCPPHRV